MSVATSGWPQLYLNSMIKLTAKQIETWVSKHFEYKSKSKGRQLVINNPFNGDTGWHFWIATYPDEIKKGPAKGRSDCWAHDFRPGEWSGSFLRFVKEYKNISFYDAVKEVCGGSTSNIRDYVRQQLQANIPKEEIVEPEERIIELPPRSKPLTEDKSSRAREIAINYLANRKISEETAIRNFVHYRPGAVVFPYLEYGMMVYWQERSIISKEFLFPDEMETGLQKSDYIYGFDQIEPNGYAIMVESIFNALSLGDDVGASGGADIIGKQVNKLRALNPHTIILAPDNDDAGVKSLKRNFYALQHLPSKLAYSLPPPDMDWNDMDKELGAGSARKYLEDNVYALNIKTIAKLFIKLPTQK